MPLGTLGKYERLDVLGHGASGIVYLAKDTLLGKQVALKEISAQGEEATRFLEEARVLDRLRHPNIVHVFGVDQIGGKVVLAMEYVRGSNLQDILRETPQLPLTEVVNIAAQICDGLAFAHQNRTVHRDIKPANVLVTREGQVKLVDFGLAEVLGTHSMAGGAGTYAYMAPEDFHEEQQSDRQSDIWAVGVILYEMLAGKRPFQVAKAKDPFAWKRAVEEDPLVPVTNLRSDIPAALDVILARALARDKRHRYFDAADMAAQLRALPLSAPVSQMGKGEEWWLHTEDAPPLVQKSLPDFPTVTDIDTYLAAAPDHWAAARAALIGGGLQRWLVQIGEIPLSDVATRIAAEPGRDDDEKLRDFLYRAGLETTAEARRAYQGGSRALKSGEFNTAAFLLRRAVSLDPRRPIYHQELAHALSAGGDAAAAALALEEGLTQHPKERTLQREHSQLVGSRVSVSAAALDFGVLRQGQHRAARLMIRNEGEGVLQGRVVSTPGWVRVEPAAFSTRQRQPLMVTADTSSVLQAPATFTETIVLETNGGRQEISVAARILPARRDLSQIAVWYLPLLACCLLPVLAGLAAPTLSAHAAHHLHVRHLWEPGAVATGLLGMALLVLTTVADTSWGPRLIPVALLALAGFGLGGLAQGMNSGDTLATRLALAQTTPPILILLILFGFAAYRDPRGWGRWQLWGWITAATGLLVSYALLHTG